MIKFNYNNNTFANINLILFYLNKKFDLYINFNFNITLYKSIRKRL